MAEVFSDFAKSTLSASINASVTSIDVIDGSKFPAPTGGDFFFAAIVEGSTIEIVKVTARTLENMTVVRAQGGTVAAAFSSGALVSHRAFAETYETLAAGGGGGGAAVGRKYKSAEYYAPPGLVGAGTAAQNVGVMRAVPFVVFASTTFDRIGVECTTAGATSIGRLGIYNDDGGKPGTKVLTATGTIDCSTTGAKELTIAQTLAAGVYWLALQVEVALATFRTLGGVSDFLPQPTSGPSQVAAWEVTGQTAGSLAAPFPTPTAVTNSPRIFLRAQ